MDIAVLIIGITIEVIAIMSLKDMDEMNPWMPLIVLSMGYAVALLLSRIQKRLPTALVHAAWGAICTLGCMVTLSWIIGARFFMFDCVGIGFILIGIMMVWYSRLEATPHSTDAQQRT